MCEKHYCTHSPETLCSCAPVQSGDVAQIVFHMAENWRTSAGSWTTKVLRT